MYFYAFSPIPYFYTKQPIIAHSASILETPIEFLKGVGPQRGELLYKELQIASFNDLLYHFPYRYYDRSVLNQIKDINITTEYVQLAGKVLNIVEEGTGRKKRLVATLFDDTGSIELIWFQGIQWAKKNIEENGRYIVFGKVSSFNGFFSIAHPEMESWQSANTLPQMQPVYSTTERLRNMGITNRSFAKLTQSVFEKLKPHDVVDFIPPYILQHYQLANLYTALRWIHFPKNHEQELTGRRRMKWEELFLSQMRIARLRQQHIIQPGYIFEKVGDYFNDFFNYHLPFELTNAQKRVLKEIRIDTASGKQMNRLLQGDVGSGKTIVALMTMLLALDNGFQACLMAPTEILAQQHFQSIHGLLEAMHIPVALLTGSVKGKEKKDILKALESGILKVIIGTHALIEDSVKFHNLGMAVIDEQHRFGVNQRARLWQKNEKAPHVLVMTATPIPRTLAMTLYGDLDVSVIDELPPGRKEIVTGHRNEMQRATIMSFIRSEIDKGRQAYIVYPLIEESEKLDYESLMTGYEQVKVFFPEHKYNIAMVHGKQDPAERERNMQRFIKGQAHILVATTVIEVGVNVFNASVMLIESAERFGLSQLHQLRGRVGRGAEQSYCILLTGSKLSEDSKKRMKIMTSTADGFVIAEQDLALRGPGDLYGTRQSGVLKLKIADIVEDADIVEETRNAAKHLLASDPSLKRIEHQPLLYHLLEGGEKHNLSKIS